ncbi:MAG: efflux RND transporter periplasmic adaptor subunit [Ferrovibrionaceae bacterium]
MKRVVLVAILLAGAAGGGILVHYRQADGRDRPVSSTPLAPVTVAAVHTQPEPVERTTIGRVQAISSVAIKVRLDGQITSVPVKDGQDVKAGDVLFTFDDRALKAAVHQAQAQLARDQTQVEAARREAERQGQLAQKEFASQRAVDVARAGAEMAQATLKVDQAMLEMAETQLSYAVIRAPIDGRLGSIGYKVGSVVKSGDASAPLVTLNQLRPIYVSFALPQQDFAPLRTAQARGPVKVLAAVPGEKGAPVVGELAFIDNAIDAATSTVQVKAAFPNEDTRLWPGQFVNVTVTLAVEAEAMVVPSVAVQSGQNGTYVFVVKPDQTATIRPVTVDRVVGTDSVVTKGLDIGEQVVVTGQLRLDEGVKVDIRKGTPVAELRQ